MPMVKYREIKTVQYTVGATRSLRPYSTEERKKKKAVIRMDINIIIARRESKMACFAYG